MGTESIDWTAAIGVLVVGLVFGTLLVWRMRSGDATPPEPAPDSLEHRDLLGQRDVLLRQLAELEATSAKRSPEQLARERYALELDTARVLQELERQLPAWTTAAPELPTAGPPASLDVPTSVAVPTSVDVPAPAARPALRGFLWGTGSMVALALLVFLVTQAARPREPGGIMTGELPPPPPPSRPVSTRRRFRPPSSATPTTWTPGWRWPSRTSSDRT